jgi:hypothetical protein
MLVFSTIGIPVYIFVHLCVFTFCSFRLNNHKLPVEYGRWNNIHRELGICNLCNTADLGDEFHYLLKCDYFSEKKKTCIAKKYFKNCNILKP